MKFGKKWLLGGIAAASVLLAAAGLYTNNLPQLSAGTVNTVAQNAVLSQLDPGQQVTLAGQAPNCCGSEMAVDTNLAGGAAPGTVSATPFQVAATFGDAYLNSQTSTVHAATSNTLGGIITTESLTTAAGATYTFTLTNSVLNTAYIAAGTMPQVAIYSGTNTGGRITGRNSAALVLTSQVMTNGSVVWVFTNNGTTALNGTMFIVWHL